MSPRQKRIAQKGKVEVQPTEVTRAPSIPVIKAICPVCGSSIPEKRAIKIGYVTVDRINFFESVEWDENKPFGVRFFATGKAGFKEWEYISPEEAPEFFQALKARFLQALREWVIDKKWITQEEIKRSLRR